MRPLAGRAAGAGPAKLAATGPSDTRALPAETFRKSRRDGLFFMTSSKDDRINGISAVRCRWPVTKDNGLRTSDNYANFVISILGLNTSFDFCSSSQVMG